MHYNRFPNHLDKTKSCFLKIKITIIFKPLYLTNKSCRPISFFFLKEIFALFVSSIFGIISICELIVQTD